VNKLVGENMKINDYKTVIKGLVKGDDLFQSNFKNLRNLMVQDSKFLGDKKFNLSQKTRDWNPETLNLVKSWNVSERYFDTISRAYRSSTKLDSNGKLNKKGMALSGKSIQNLGLTEEAKKSGWKAKDSSPAKPKAKKVLSNDEKLSLIGLLFSDLTKDKFRPTEDRLNFLRDKIESYELAIQDIPATKTAINGKN
jgi:hypothetical protein